MQVPCNCVMLMVGVFTSWISPKIVLPQPSNCFWNKCTICEPDYVWSVRWYEKLMIHILLSLLLKLLFIKFPFASLKLVQNFPLKIHKTYWDIDEQDVSWSCSETFGASVDITSSKFLISSFVFIWVDSRSFCPLPFPFFFWTVDRSGISGSGFDNVERDLLNLIF